MAPWVPIHEYLVPDVPPRASDDATRVRQPIVGGLPHRIVVDGDVALLLVVGSGLADTWRRVAPDTVITQSAPELALAGGSRRPLEIGSAHRASARLLLLRDTTILAALPLALGLHRAAPDIGAEEPGSLLEIDILGWSIRAGNLRGPGDFGGYIDVAWRRADAGSSDFSQPPVHPAVAQRLPMLGYASFVGGSSWEKHGHATETS